MSSVKFFNSVLVYYSNIFQKLNMLKWYMVCQDDFVNHIDQRYFKILYRMFRTNTNILHKSKNSIRNSIHK